MFHRIKLFLYHLKRLPVRLSRSVYFLILKMGDCYNKTDFYSYTMKLDSPSSHGFDNNKVHRSTPSGFLQLEGLIKRNKWIGRGNIIDIGCGKGSAMKLFLRLGFSKVGGIEINKHIYAICAQNFKMIKAHVELVNRDALEYSDYGDFDTFYLYNPFPCEIFTGVLQLIQSAKKNKKVTLIYSNNVCHELVLSVGFVEKDRITDIWGNSIAVYTFEEHA